MNRVGFQPAPGGSAPVQWMSAPAAGAQGCPTGLEDLSQVDQLFIHELHEMVEGNMMRNRYLIKNNQGEQVYFAYEESDTCEQFCTLRRGCTMHILDNNDQEVIRTIRPFMSGAGCGWCAGNDCCAFIAQVEAPPGNIVGYVKQAQYWWGPKLDILNKEKECVLKIQGPFSMFQNQCCKADIDFDIMSKNINTAIGKVAKQWPADRKVSWTDSDHFGVTFPADLEVSIKATLLAAVFLIEFMFFEKDKTDGGLMDQFLAG